MAAAEFEPNVRALLQAAGLQGAPQAAAVRRCVASSGAQGLALLSSAPVMAALPYEGSVPLLVAAREHWATRQAHSVVVLSDGTLRLRGVLANALTPVHGAVVMLTSWRFSVAGRVALLEAADWHVVAAQPAPVVALSEGASLHGAVVQGVRLVPGASMEAQVAAAAPHPVVITLRGAALLAHLATLRPGAVLSVAGVWQGGALVCEAEAGGRLRVAPKQRRGAPLHPAIASCTSLVGTVTALTSTCVQLDGSASAALYGAQGVALVTAQPGVRVGARVLLANLCSCSSASGALLGFAAGTWSSAHVLTPSHLASAVPPSTQPTCPAVVPPPVWLHALAAVQAAVGDSAAAAERLTHAALPPQTAVYSAEAVAGAMLTMVRATARVGARLPLPAALAAALCVGSWAGDGWAQAAAQLPAFDGVTHTPQAWVAGRLCMDAASGELWLAAGSASWRLLCDTAALRVLQPHAVELAQGEHGTPVLLAPAAVSARCTASQVGADTAPGPGVPDVVRLLAAVFALRGKQAVAAGAPLPTPPPQPSRAWHEELTLVVRGAGSVKPLRAARLPPSPQPAGRREELLCLDACTTRPVLGGRSVSLTTLCRLRDGETALLQVSAAPEDVLLGSRLSRGTLFSAVLQRRTAHSVVGAGLQLIGQQPAAELRPPALPWEGGDLAALEGAAAKLGVKGRERREQQPCHLRDVCGTLVKAACAVRQAGCSSAPAARHPPASACSLSAGGSEVQWLLTVLCRDASSLLVYWSSTALQPPLLVGSRLRLTNVKRLLSPTTGRPYGVTTPASALQLLALLPSDAPAVDLRQVPAVTIGVLARGAGAGLNGTPRRLRATRASCMWFQAAAQLDACASTWVLTDGTGEVLLRARGALSWALAGLPHHRVAFWQAAARTQAALADGITFSGALGASSGSQFVSDARRLHTRRRRQPPDRTPVPLAAGAQYEPLTSAVLQRLAAVVVTTASSVEELGRLLRLEVRLAAFHGAVVPGGTPNRSKTALWAERFGCGSQQLPQWTHEVDVILKQRFACTVAALDEEEGAGGAAAMALAAELAWRRGEGEGGRPTPAPTTPARVSITARRGGTQSTLTRRGPKVSADALGVAPVLPAVSLADSLAFLTSR